MPRLFIALALPAESQSALAALMDQEGTAASEAIPRARWVVPEQLHVTIRFLGDIASEEVAHLRERLARVRAPAFTLALAGVGVFPAGRARKPPRVLWAGLTPGAPVAALKRRIDDQVGPDPEEVDRPYAPHVTLARLAEPPFAAVAPFLARHERLSGEAFAVKHFHLYQSRTAPTGAVYTLLASFPLQVGMDGMEGMDDGSL